jgi:hypothetical protein
MRSTFLTRSSDDGLIILVSQAKQVNDFFGFAVLACSSFQFHWALLDLPPCCVFSLNGNDLGASDSMQEDFCLVDSLGFRDLDNISSRGISACKRIPFLSFWLLAGPSAKITFIQFPRNLFWRTVII